MKKRLKKHRVFRFGRIILYASILLLESVSAHAQPDTLWTRTYGGNGSEEGWCVQQTSDGGFILVGSTNSYGAGDADAWLLKIDSTGDTVWTRTYGGVRGDGITYVQETSDGGFIMVGATGSFSVTGYDSDVWLIRTDASGDTLWTRTYGDSNSDVGWSGQQTSDSGFIIVGFTDSFGAGFFDVLLIKTDATGDTLWTRTYGGSERDYGFSVRQLTDGGYILTGYTDSFGSGSSDIWLIRTDASGDTLWTRTYGLEFTDRGYSVQETADDGFILTGSVTGTSGNQNVNLLLLKTDASGNMSWGTLWAAAYGGENYDVGLSVQQTSDGGYVTTGYTYSFGAGDADIWLLRADSTGDTLWTRTFGGSNHDLARSVQQTTDGGFIIAGKTTSFGAGGSDLWLIRLEANSAPVLYPIGNQSTLEDSAITIILSAIDFDDDTLTFSASSSEPNVTTSLSGSSLTITPSPDWYGLASITVNVTDGSHTDSETFTLTINPVNDPPQFMLLLPDTGFTEDDTLMFPILTWFPYVEDVDDPDSILSWSFLNEDHVIGTIMDGNVSLISDPDWSGSDTLKVVVSDTFYSDTTDFVVTVGAVNDPPVLSALPDISFNEDEGLTFALSEWYPHVDDPDDADSALTWTVLGGDSIIAVISDDSVEFSTPLNWFGADTLKVVVSDTAYSDTSDVFVIVLPVNDPPVVTDIPDTSFYEDDSLTIDLDLYASDVDDSLSWLVWDVSAVGGSPLSSKSAGGKTTKAFLTPSSVSQTGDVELKVKRVPGKSFAGNRGFGFIESPPVVTSGDTVTITIDSMTHIATISATLNYNVENVPFLFTATDTSGASDSDTMRVTVLPVNDPPVLSALPDISFNEDEGLTFALSEWYPYVDDPDDADSALAWTVLSSDSIIAVISDDSVEFSTPLNWFGAETLKVVVGDMQYSDTTSLIVDVTPVNDPPVVDDIPTVIFEEDSTYSLDLDYYVYDVDNDTTELAWTVNVLVGSATENLARQPDVIAKELILRGRRRVSAGTDSDFVSSKTAGIDRKVAAVSIEMKGASKQLNETIPAVGRRLTDKPQRIGKVDYLVKAPGVQNDSFDKKTVVYLLSESGEVLDSLSITINPISHIATFQAPPNYFAFNLPVVFTATDPGGLSGDDTTLVTISPVNDPPVLETLPNVVFNEDESVTVHFVDWFQFVNDPDDLDSTLNWVLKSGIGDSVSFIILGDSVKFTSPPDWFAFGRDTITVTVSDGYLFDSTGLAVHVFPVNDPPVLFGLLDTIAFSPTSSFKALYDTIVYDLDDSLTELTWSTEGISPLDSLVFLYDSDSLRIEIRSLFGWEGEKAIKIIVSDTSSARDTSDVYIIVSEYVGINSENEIVPDEYELIQNYPNPFNPYSTIRYGLPRTSNISLIIYNLTGQEIIRWDEQSIQPGYYEKTWNGTNKYGEQVASGIYLYRLVAGEYTAVKKMLLLK